MFKNWAKRRVITWTSLGNDQRGYDIKWARPFHATQGSWACSGGNHQVMSRVPSDRNDAADKNEGILSAQWALIPWRQSRSQSGCEDPPRQLTTTKQAQTNCNLHVCSQADLQMLLPSCLQKWKLTTMPAITSPHSVISFTGLEHFHVQVLKASPRLAPDLQITL